MQASVSVITMENGTGKNVTNLVVLAGQTHVKVMVHVIKLQGNVIVTHFGWEWPVILLIVKEAQIVMVLILHVWNHQRAVTQDVLIVSTPTWEIAVNISVYMALQYDPWMEYGHVPAILVTMVWNVMHCVQTKVPVSMVPVTVDLMVTVVISVK